MADESRRMRGRLLFGACLIGALAAGTLPGVAGEASPKARSVLEEVRQLETSVSLWETKILLGELVQKVAAATGAPLTAAPEVADEPVAVVVNGLPARKLFEELAVLLDYRWRRRGAAGPALAPLAAARRPLDTRGPRYEIWQDLASKQREEALRRAVLADLLRRFHAEVGQWVALASLSTDQLGEILTAQNRSWQEQMRLPPERREALASAPAARQRSMRFQIAQRLPAGVPRELARLLGRLSPPQWETLRREGAITLATHPRPGELPLPAEVARGLRRCPGWSAVRPGSLGRAELLLVVIAASEILPAGGIRSTPNLG